MIAKSHMIKIPVWINIYLQVITFCIFDNESVIAILNAESIYNMEGSVIENELSNVFYVATSQIV